MTWREDLAWTAGFFDGEGNSGVTTQNYPRVCVGQTERTTLDRMVKVLGVGKVYGPYAKNRDGWSDMYMYIAQGWEQSQAVAAMLWPFLSEPKKAQFTRTLTSCTKTTVGRCRAKLHNIEQVGRIDNRCAACYRAKHPNTNLVATFDKNGRVAP